MDKVAYWIDIADYDLETAKAMYSTKRWLYVGFMCHQVIEKTLKAYWCASQEQDPPYTHNIVKLAVDSKLADEMSEEQNSFIDEMMPLNIEARYPSYKEQLSKRLTPAYCQIILKQTEELQLWIKSKLSI